MTIDKIPNLFIITLGLFLVIKFRYAGKTALEQRKKLNKFLPLRQSAQDFDALALVITQFMFLFIGILFFLVGLARLLQ